MCCCAGAVFRSHEQLTVYHPNSDNGHAFINVGFTAFIGSFSGASSASTATCEIGVAFPDDTFGKESRFGIPFTYILRDLLQFDNTLQDAQNRINSAHRTCDLILGFGSGKENMFMGVEYSHSVANFYNTSGPVPPLYDWHPAVPGVTYWAMDCA